jgi:uncharacterized protein (UPF0276 family)
MPYPHPSPEPAPRAGVSLKPQHYRAILETAPEVGFFEVHAENYMGAGGPPHRYLSAIRERYPLSVHGVGLSMGGSGALDREHLGRLAEVVRRYRPDWVSEHLAWSVHDGVYFDDLLPLPYTAETLARVAEHVDQVQSALGRPILLENPSTYVRFADHDWSEPDFLREVVRRTGCGLLLDVNNVFVSSVNQQQDGRVYIEDFPLEAVGEIHLAGHATEADAEGRPLLIDTHDGPVCDAVWDLYAAVLARRGPVATLIEWDARLPPLDGFLAEAGKAEQRLAACAESADHAELV